MQKGWDYAETVTLKVGIEHEPNNVSPNESLKELMQNINI